MKNTFLLSLNTVHLELWLVFPSTVYAFMGSPLADPSLQWILPEVAVKSSTNTAPGAPGGPKWV